MSELNYQNHSIDLHNCYIFLGTKYSLDTKRAWLLYRRRDSATDSNAPYSGIFLKFENVSNLYKKSHDIDYPLEYLEEDSQTPDLMGFSYKGDKIMEGPTSNKKENGLDSLIFTFVTGKSIKIEADSVELIINKNES